MDVVGLMCYTNGNVVNGPNGIEYNKPPHGQINVDRYIAFETFIERLCNELFIDRSEGLEIIFRYGSGVAESTFYVPISIRSEHDLRFMLNNAPSLPNTMDLFITQLNVHSLSPIRQGDCENVEDVDPMNATNKEVVETDDTDSDPENMDEFYGVDDVPSYFTTLDMDAISSVPDTGIQKEIRGTDSLLKGMMFESKIELKNVVKRYSILHHQNFEVVETNKRIWSIRCLKHSEGCKWRLRAICSKKHGRFEITKYDGPHSCVYARLSQDHSQLDSNLIASEVRSVIKENPSVNIKTLQNIILQKYSYFVHYWKVWDGKRKAIINVFGDWDESYNLLPKFLNILELTNPGTQVLWRMFEVEGSAHEAIFSCVFWAFGPVIEGFKHCRPMIQIDGTHLYGKYGGKLLIASSVDANGRVYPLAYAIVPEESSDTWGWFLYNLWDKVVCKRPGLCIISDRHKGIISAIRNPRNGWADAQHRFCLRHVVSNFNQKYKDAKLKKLVYRAGAQFQVRKFQECMTELETANRDCMRFFASLDHKQWTQSHDGGHRYGWLTTNAAECINGVFKGARKLPITALVQTTFYKTVTYFALHRVEIEAAIASGTHFTR